MEIGNCPVVTDFDYRTVAAPRSSEHQYLESGKKTSPPR